MLTTNNVFAQFEIDPDETEIDWGDLHQNSEYEWTFTIKSWAPESTDFEVYSSQDLDYWAPWLDIEPTEFTLEFGQEQEIVFSGIYNEIHFYGEHWISITFEQYDEINSWHNVTLSWTSYPPFGIEDYLSWTDYTEIFNELETITYGMEYHDEYPYNTPIEWNLEMKLFTIDGEYLIL